MRSDGVRSADQHDGVRLGHFQSPNCSRYAFAVRKGNAELRRKVDDALLKVIAMGYDQMIYDRYWRNNCTETPLTM